MGFLLSDRYDNQIETWKQYARRVTEPLQHVRKGTMVQNIRSQAYGIVAEDIYREHPFVHVLCTARHGKHRGREVKKAWHASNVRVVKKRGK